MDPNVILNKLRHCHNTSHKKGTIIGSNLLNQIINGKIKLTPQQLSDFLDAYYINAYYYDKTLATKICQYYINKAIEDPEFYQVFLKRSEERRVGKECRYML